MAKIPYNSRYPRTRGFIPQPGYASVLAQCKGCLRLWTNVGIRYSETTERFSFDFDTRSDIMGEVDFHDKEEVVICKKCSGKVKFFRW